MRLNAFTSQLRASTSSAVHSQQESNPIVPGSPPPYSPEPPESVPPSPFLVRRSSSTPHLNSPPLPCTEPGPSNPHSYSLTNSRNPSSSALYSPTAPRPRASFSREETDDDTDAATSGDDTVVYRSPTPTLAGSLRERLFGRGRVRADHGERVRLISTTPGVHGAGETETEGEDTQPRNLPTARLRPTTLPSLSAHSPLSASMTIPLPSLDPAHRQRAILDLAPLLFESCRLLAVVPAVFGTFWNLYRALMPLENSWRWRVDYVVCIIWSVLTGWQCLQLTTGLLKRWRVYYSPLPTLIRLLALQAICWPATHFTLSLLDHEARPLICWAAIGTTTCCSRSIQMWVTSNIVEPPGSASSDANMKRRSKRKWDGPAVLRECVLPAGIAYFVTAWVLLLGREFETYGRSS